MPELNELRALRAAAELGSLGRAAVRLHVSQQALSKRLRALETIVGTKLLERSSQGVTLTRAGQVLYEEASDLLRDADALEMRILSLRDEHMPVRLAVSPTFADFVLPWKLADTERETGHHPTLELTAVNSATAIRMITDASVDLAIVALGVDQTPDGLVEIPLCRDEVVLAVPEGHHWAALEEVPLQAFLSTSLIMRDPGANTRRTVEQILRENDLALAPALLEVGSTAEVREAARRRRAPALVSEMAVAGAEGLLRRRVAGMRFERRFSILLRGESSLSVSARVLVDQLRGDLTDR